jgi:thiamine pyrophosphate-dependent acetolactate synthase large subunit-like protein
VNGLYDAQMDHQPVVAIVGQSARTAIGADYQQEVDLESLFKDVARNYVHTCMVPAQARHLIDRAMRIAFAERTVTCVILPNDVQEEEAVETPPPRSSMPANASRSSSAPVRWAPRTRCSRPPTSSAPAWRRRCSARRWSPTICRS